MKIATIQDSAASAELKRETKNSLCRPQGPVEVAGSRAAVHEEVRPGDERALAPQHELRELRELRYLVRGAGTASRTLREHVLVEVAARPVELVDRQKRHALRCSARHPVGVQRVVDRTRGEPDLACSHQEQH